MPTHPSSPFSHAHTRTHHQPDSCPPGLAQWACYIKASSYGSRVGWTHARRIHTYLTRLLLDHFLAANYCNIFLPSPLFFCSQLLWSPYVIGQTIIFMAALCNRCGHYIFALWLLSFYLFFPRLISAAGDCMSTILPHMVWP